jgi:hypothetical protein
MKAFISILAAIMLCLSAGDALAQGRSGGHGFFNSTINGIENVGRSIGRSIGRVPGHLGFGGHHNRARLPAESRAKPPSGIGTSRVNSALIGHGHSRHFR